MTGNVQADTRLPDLWTPQRIKRLRGHRTQAEFGKLIRVPKNTVWRWEAGYVSPDSKRSQRLSKLAAKERFLRNWELVGSAVLLGDLEEGSRHIARHLKPQLGRSVSLLE